MPAHDSRNFAFGDRPCLNPLRGRATRDSAAGRGGVLLAHLGLG